MIMKKNILIVGASAVATALAKKLKQDNSVNKIYIAGGSLVESEDYQTVDIRVDDLTGLLKFVIENDIFLTIPVCEDALASDIVNFFQANGQKIFGPIRQACNNFLNKANSKKLLYKMHIPTSKFGIFDKVQLAQTWLKSANFPILIRCLQTNSHIDRMVCPTYKYASEFVENIFLNGETNVLLEEYIFGHNFTIYFMTDGYSAIPISTVANYKFMNDGDNGQFTKGAGCYAPDYRVGEEIESKVCKIVLNILNSLDKKGFSYTGVIGVDCTITGDENLLINEFYTFIQNHDASVVLSQVEDSILNLMFSCIEGYFSDEYDSIKHSNLACVAAVVFGLEPLQKIEGLRLIEPGNIDFINVKKDSDGNIMTTADEVLTLCRCASTLSTAKKYLYEDLAELNFKGIKYRKDICS